MKQIDLTNTPHQFEKTNSITKFKGNRSYDEYKCRKCGMIGRRYDLSNFITLIKNYSQNLVDHCCYKNQQVEDQWINKLIQITHCHAYGKQFINVINNSYHRIIPPPQKYRNGDKGVWIMGDGEPVKVLFGEFKLIQFKRL